MVRIGRDWVRMSPGRCVLLCHTPWTWLGHDFGRFGLRVFAMDPVVVRVAVRLPVWEGVCDVGE